MKPIFLSAAIGITFSASCLKVELGSRSQNYEHGRLLIEFKDSVTIQSAANTCFELNTTILKIVGFCYKSNLPNDSLAMVRAILLLKPYVEPSTIGPSVIAGVSNKILISGLVLHDVNENDMQDLLRMQDSLGWIEYPYVGKSYPHCKSILVQVPIGAETEFAQVFDRDKGVRTIRLYNVQMD